jgi:cytochrome c551/c552
VPETHSDDPIQSRSLAGALLISAFLLLLTVAWSFYDEFFGLRPWRSYQREFASVYAKYLQKQIPIQGKREEEIRNSPEYKKLADQVKAAADVSKPKLQAIDTETTYIAARLAALQDTFTTARGKVTAAIYDAEIQPQGSNARKSRLKDVDEAKAETYSLELPTRDGKIEAVKWNFAKLDGEFNALKARQAALVAERGEALRPAKELQEQVDAYFKEKMEGLTRQQLSGLLNAAEHMNVDIRQINVNPANQSINNFGSGGLVDRCQSCHVGADPKLVPPAMVLTKVDLALDKNKDAPYASHPASAAELLKIHDTARFGCSPCHGGNGRAIDSVERGHGRYEHWLWPLHYKENYEAGCQTCHNADMVTEHAPVLNRGKQLFRQKGCIGCHKFEGFDDEPERLLAARQQIRQLEGQKRDDEIEIPRLQKAGDNAPDNAIAQKSYAQATNLTVTVSNIDAQVEQIDQRTNSLFREIKKVGPDLKEMRMKIRKEWIPYWLQHTHEFRPTTKMPQFRLTGDQVKAVAAFIWQSAETGPALKTNAPGNAAHGKELFETRGCLACHSMGEGANLAGGDFAANLSRVGEKDNYDYLVRWIHNPRERTRPYCPFEKRDLGPEDYAKHGLPFVFDLEHSGCPNDGHELQVQQPTVMPNLRLTVDDARDVASWLLTQKHANAKYESAEFMDDPKLKAQGLALVKNFGCAGCHEIAGLEDEGRIGTELTTEGSKPIERLDFALLTEDAKRGVLPDGKTKSPRDSWYDQKGFFEQKLANPAIYDQGKIKENPLDKLRMPKPNVTPDDITALVTFLLGSVDQQLPPEYTYKPGDQRKDIQEGWWVVTKYNCMGCHEIHVGQKSMLETLPKYQGDNKINLPPILISEGARVDPNWLAHFLANPAQSTTDTNRNGVRSYLQVRMPTFSFSDGEIQKIVRFFAAMSSQAQPYLPPKLTPLTDAERGMARALFTSTAAPCLKCHMTGDPGHDKNATAPNFLLARERLKPAWTARWITDPAKIAPGTAMPSGLFHREGNRWIFSGPLPPSFHGYAGDHADLLVRYMFQLTPEEQRSLTGRSSAAASGGAGSAGASH